MTVEARYILVYHHPDDDGPTSVRTWTLEQAQRRRQRLEQAQAASGVQQGRWTIHELSDEVVA